MNYKHSARAARICLFTTLFIIISCNKSEDSNEIVDLIQSPNILFIIADDLNCDIGVYGNKIVKTPNIDQLIKNGTLFQNAHCQYPLCGPSRASIITGKYGYRTGVKAVGDELSISEITLQEYISTQTNDEYASAIVGKWHLSGNNSTINPETFGIDYYAGLIRGAVNDYYQWPLSKNGTRSQNTEYITEAFTDLSIDWINQQSKPWFMWLAYTAPHTPFHAPPSNMHSQGNLPTYNNGLDPIPYYMAAIEAMDFQIGRLLDEIPEDERNNTIIIFIGDNGTPNQVAQSPYSSSKVKSTLYQGGVNVPMFISGNSVSRTGIDNNLITSTDLFATIAEISGVSIEEINNSKSFYNLLSDYKYYQVQSYGMEQLIDGLLDKVVQNKLYY